MNTYNTCKRFENNTSVVSLWPNHGQCKLMGDSNDIDGGIAPTNLCYGWDMESYAAGIYVGPDFGCIHWMAKECIPNAGDNA